jgi:hypothetical protein
VNTPDLEENVLCHMEEDPGTNTRRTGAMEKVSNNTVMEMLNTNCILTIFSGFSAIPLPTILEELLSADGFLKKCATIPHFVH